MAAAALALATRPALARAPAAPFWRDLPKGVGSRTRQAGGGVDDGDGDGDARSGAGGDDDDDDGDSQRETSVE